MSKVKVSIENYEIGNLKNFDLLAFYNSLPDKSVEEEMQIGFQLECEEYHHSLFYPILQYCINLLNSCNKEKLEEIKKKIGFYDKRIYVTVNRQMYDLFFTEKEDSIDNQIINFNFGKDNFNIKSFSKKINKNNIDNYKKYFDIQEDSPEHLTKAIVNKKANDLQIDIKQLIESKKRNILNRFLKGYTFQENILKTFESRIEGQFVNLPNLLFKRKNEGGGAIEEIDQIYLLNLKEETKKIKGFDCFFYYDSDKDLVGEIINNGKPLELENGKIYFIEIKKSIHGLKKGYEKLKNKEIPKNFNSFGSTFKRENFTDLGNAIITTNIFVPLIEKILSKENFTINILYIIDDDFKTDMTNIFKDCFNRDKIVMHDNYHYKIYLIYTQPDLALKYFIETNIQKNDEIKILKNKVQSFEEEMHIFKERFKEIEYDESFCQINDEVLQFCQSLQNSKKLITIGIPFFINKNHECLFSSLKNLKYLQSASLEKNNYLIDIKTFNNVKFEDIKDKNLFDNTLENYKYYIKLIYNLREVYLLVDFVFMKNLRIIFNEKILEYMINVYMFDGCYFIFHLKKEISLKEFNQIKIYRNKCQNEMLNDESEKLSLEQLEEFIENYYELFSFKNFFVEEDKIKKDKFNLFDYECKINYILNLYVKPKSHDHNIINNENCYAEIISVKKEFNIYNDILSDELIEELNFHNIIFIRKTEFGKRFNKEKIKSIIKYLFNINDIILVDNLPEETKGIQLKLNRYYKENIIYNFSKGNNILPIVIKSNEIKESIIPLIEYNYLLSVPLLLSKKVDKPHILILANDFGLLNFYYHKLYQDNFNISSFIEKKEFLYDKQEIFTINNSNINLSDFKDILNSKKKKNKKEYFDIILIEYFSQKDEKDNMIPNYEILLGWEDILNNNGILAFNLRTESLKTYEIVLNQLKKKYNMVFHCYLRPCSGIIFCCGNKSIKVENYYKPNEISLQSLLFDLIQSNLVQV